MKTIYFSVIMGMIFAALLLAGCEKTTNTTYANISDTSEDNTQETPTSDNPVVNTPNTTVPASTGTKINTTPSSNASANCIDTDGGATYDVKGTVTVDKNGAKTTYTDYCRHGDYEDYVMEYSCGTAGLVSASHKCTKGCNGNGACW